jgi:hypothetical protein
MNANHHSVFQFKPISFIWGIIILLLFSVSCTVTNNMYVNDPVPVTKNQVEAYGGFGMGLQPRIDSVSDIGEVFSSSLQRSYNLVFGGRGGITHRFTLGGNLHFPQIIGGIGINLRPQFSLFPNITPFNIAVAADIGGTFAKDSITILGSSDYQDNESKGVFTFDLSLPVSQRFGKETRLIITPRYSFNTFYLRQEFEYDRSKRFKVQYPALSVGLRANRVHMEGTVAKFEKDYKFMAGIVFFFGKDFIEGLE